MSVLLLPLKAGREMHSSNRAADRSEQLETTKQSIESSFLPGRPLIWSNIKKQ